MGFYCIIKPEWKRKGPLVLSYALVMQALYFSQFFTRFFGDFTEFVLVQMYVCSLLVSCVADNRNLNESCIFLNENTLFCTQLGPRTPVNRILGLWNFKGACPLYRHWITAPLLIQSGTLFKPAGYFYFYWNPCFHVAISLPWSTIGHNCTGRVHTVMSWKVLRFQRKSLKKVKFLHLSLNFDLVMAK